MHFSAAFVALALLVAPILAAPAGIAIQKAAGPKAHDSYIIKLNPGVQKSKTLKWLKAQLDSNSTVAYDYDSDFLNGFAGKFSPKLLAILSKSPDIASIHEDTIFSINAAVTVNNAPWGLQRITQAAKLTSTNPNTLTYRYTYDDAYAGNGVDVYILDTGINTAHVNFGGRARFGYSAISGQTADGHGHGTHCAGTAVGGLYGVSRKANVIAVKVLSDAGSGATSGIVAGINYVINQAINAGITVVVAAGNSNVDASSTSPARVAAAITVGASTITDARASFSNYGPIVDIFAPGQNVISSWIGSTTATNNISGTSMATPHVAGVVAYLFSQYGPQSPASMASLLKSIAVSGKLTGLPSGTPNLLLQL